MENNKASGLSITALVLGIASLVFGCIFGWTMWGSIIGLIAGIVGIILAVMGKKKDHSGVATGGLVTSIIGLVLSAIFFLSCVACAGLLSAAASTAALS